LFKNKHLTLLKKTILWKKKMENGDWLEKRFEDGSRRGRREERGIGKII